MLADEVWIPRLDQRRANQQEKACGDVERSHQAEPSIVQTTYRERSRNSQDGEKQHEAPGSDDVADASPLSHGRQITARTAFVQRKEAMAWFWLIVGGLFEVGFTTSLRFVDGFRNAPWTIAFLLSVAISMGLLELAARTIPMGTAYAVWGGIGAVGTVLVGIAFFNEPSTMIR